MYNSKDLCFDDELTRLSYNQLVNHTFNINEVMNSHLWFIVSCEGYYKCIPLFNCDKIESSDSNDIVVDDNKCLFTLGDEDTIISCISSDTGGIHYHTFEAYAYTPYHRLDVLDSVYVYCIIYDEYLNTVNNEPVEVFVDDELTSKVYTDNNGVCRYTVKNTCSIQFKYLDTTSNVVTIIN